jgi:hypothetical protein
MFMIYKELAVIFNRGSAGQGQTLAVSVANTARRGWWRGQNLVAREGVTTRWPPRPERAEGSGTGCPRYCPPRQPERSEPPFRLLEEEAAASREIPARDAAEEFKNSTP